MFLTYGLLHGTVQVTVKSTAEEFTLLKQDRRFVLVVKLNNLLENAVQTLKDGRHKTYNAVTNQGKNPN